MYLSGNLRCKMGSYGDNECKLFNLLAEKYIQKGMHLGDNDPKKGSLGDKNNVERVFGGA